MYRFLISRRWLGLLAMAVTVALGCGLLGLWQWERREDRLARNAVVEQNYDRFPGSLDTVLPPGRTLATDREWTPVALVGTYLSEATVLLRNRPLNGQSGYHQLVPLVTRNDQVVVIDRGWLPAGQTGEEPDSVPAPPSGLVQVTARLRPPEPLDGRSAPVGQTQRINPAALAESIADRAGIGADAVVTGAYGVLAGEEPPAQARPTLLPRPVTDEGPHLSYAAQWALFALGALVVFGVVARRTAHDEVPRAQRPSARGREPTDEEIEDALLDATAPRPPS